MEVEELREEKQVPLDSKPMDKMNPDEKGKHEWEMCLRNLREAQQRTSEVLGKSRTSSQVKTEVEGIWTRVIGEVGEFWGKRQGGNQLDSWLEREIAATLSQRGIESADDWKEYLRTMEQDGETMADICDMLRTDAAHLKGKIAALQRQWRSKEESIGVQSRIGQPSGTTSRGQGVQWQTMPLIGQGYGDTWPQSPVSTLPARDDRDVSVSQNLLTYLRSMACADPGVFSGAKNENFEEFVRRFKRKYEMVIGSEATLVEILGDDHLGGRAKSVFSALPRAIKEQGLNAVISEMTKLLSQESTAGRLRALTELRNLKIGPGQEVSEFCILLEKLGKQANPDCTIEDRSLEYAQILLDNLSDWPEHFQLVGALHRVDARKAYEEVKELALSIEQSKLMFESGRKSRGSQWRRRAAQYRCVGMTEEEEIPQVDFESAREERARIYENDGGNGNRNSIVRNETQYQLRYGEANEFSSSQDGSDNRKCYKCLRYGHIARNCPQSSIRVKQVRKQDLGERKTLSEIINEARNLGMTVKDKCGNTGLIGGRIVKQLRLLGGSSPALLDTGSMVSVVPVQVLAKAQDRGFDVNALKVVQKSQLAPVWDASNRRMEFLGAVFIEAELKGGNQGVVPFYISPAKNDEIILGTNALAKLGVKVSVVGEIEEGRVYVPPRNVPRVLKQCNGNSVEVKRVSGVCKDGFAHGKVATSFSKQKADVGRRRTRVSGKNKPEVGNNCRRPVREAGFKNCRAHPGMDAANQCKRRNFPQGRIATTTRQAVDEGIDFSEGGGMSEGDMPATRDQL